jgi:transposase, IS5 family
MRGQPGFFDIDDRLKRLSDLGDQLETFRSAVDFELFQPELNAVLSYTDRTEGGRPPFDPVLMFKILVIQATNNLSDERAEFLINDRLSFMRFLGLGLEDRVPDARTIWLFREKLTTAGAIKRLFEQFDAMLRQAGYIAMSGQIVDASLVAAPRQRNTADEKKAIKQGRQAQRASIRIIGGELYGPEDRRKTQPVGLNATLGKWTRLHIFGTARRARGTGHLSKGQRG